MFISKGPIDTNSALDHVMVRRNKWQAIPEPLLAQLRDAISCR